jgi:hypothetical protein
MILNIILYDFDIRGQYLLSVTRGGNLTACRKSFDRSKRRERSSARKIFPRYRHRSIIGKLTDQETKIKTHLNQLSEMVAVVT